MITQMKTQLWFLSILIFTVQECRPVCVDPNAHAHALGLNVSVESEAVVGSPMKLLCISCLKREEIEAETKVNWYYNPGGKLIYQFDNWPRDLDGPWKGRLVWNGSKDMQDVSISITNVTMNDSGSYTCEVHRKFFFNLYTPTFSTRIQINLVVRKEASKDPTALYSEIMMYVLLVFLTFWLLVEMIYCYRKISKSDEQAQDSAY
ncbi:sodium channel subunit beta-3 isoform X2 [Hoplias malabaricus]|uniref:sodium channel subunit beta-3 isoform X2 n=1 Tax=Hoplias malabaricus TaxID=27720 RepID=UPI003461CC1E